MQRDAVNLHALLLLLLAPAALLPTPFVLGAQLSMDAALSSRPPLNSRGRQLKNHFRSAVRLPRQRSTARR